jgi:site-specific recombinase XerD
LLERLARYFAGVGKARQRRRDEAQRPHAEPIEGRGTFFFDYLVLRGTLRHSPARLRKNGRTNRPIPKALTDDEVRGFEKALAAAAKESAIGRRDHVLFTLLLKGGMRLTAALAIDVKDLNLAECSAVSRGKHRTIQSAYLPRRVARMLGQHIDLVGIARRVTAHSLRYQFAAELHRRTGDLQVAQAALGHRHLGTTIIDAAMGSPSERPGARCTRNTLRGEI